MGKKESKVRDKDEDKAFPRGPAPDDTPAEEGSACEPMDPTGERGHDQTPHTPCPEGYPDEREQ